jgi:hypothetical protein
MKKDPDTEKGRNVTAVRHDEKSALRLDAILAEIPFIIPRMFCAGLLALEEMSQEERLAIIMKAADKAKNH